LPGAIRRCSRSQVAGAVFLAGGGRAELPGWNAATMIEHYTMTIAY